MIKFFKFANLTFQQEIDIQVEENLTDGHLPSEIISDKKVKQSLTKS